MITSALAKSRLAHAIRRGDDPGRIAELRTAYYKAKTYEHLAGLIADRKLTPGQCLELAGMLAANGAASVPA